MCDIIIINKRGARLVTAALYLQYPPLDLAYHRHLQIQVWFVQQLKK